MTSTGMSDLAFRKLPRGTFYPGRLRHCSAFKVGIIGDGRLGAAEPQDRGIQIIEGLAFGDQRADFGPDALGAHTFINAQKLAGFLDRSDDGVSVDRADRAQVDHLDLDPFL